MNEPDQEAATGKAFHLFAFFGFVAPLLTFAVAMSRLSADLKIAILGFVAFVYSALFFWVYYKQKSEPLLSAADRPSSQKFTESSAADKLEALDEANRFFGASLNQAEMFRLVSARVREIFPMNASVLFVPNTETLVVTAVEGDISNELEGTEIEMEQSLAGLAFLSGEIELDADLSIESHSRVSIRSARSAAALPIIYDGRVFAVYQLFTGKKIEDTSSVVEILQSIQNRITPLLLGSFAADRSLSNALSDGVTSLPNERALLIVLENQLAECMRYRDERPLSVIAADIKQFDETSRTFGHSTGDRILTFVAERLRAELRKMDFLARSSNDEFVIVLPAANSSMAVEVTERIRTALAENAFKIDDADEINLRMNFGTATFWQDGETPHQLLRHAQLEKQQAKAEEPDNVVMFPKEYVN